MFDITNNFLLESSCTFPKAIIHECKRSCKFDNLCSNFVYGMSDEAVHCIGCAMFYMARNKGPSVCQ